MFLSAQQEGIIFEERVHSLLSNIRTTQILREKDIRKTYGSHISAIDHMFILDNYCICIQDKWQKTTISNKDYNHFIVCLYDINQRLISTNKKIIGIYLSKFPLSKEALVRYNEENDKQFIKLFCFDNENQNKLLKELSLFLHSNGIYLTDLDGDSIMI
jgi:hypothetical protein